MASNDRWLPLESNPDVMNKFIHGMGVPADHAFCDIYGTDEALLGMVISLYLLLHPILFFFVHVCSFSNTPLLIHVPRSRNLARQFYCSSRRRPRRRTRLPKQNISRKMARYNKIILIFFSVPIDHIS